MAISSSSIVRLLTFAALELLLHPLIPLFRRRLPVPCRWDGDFVYLCEDIHENVRCVFSGDHFVVRLNRSFLASAVLVCLRLLQVSIVFGRLCPGLGIRFFTQLSLTKAFSVFLYCAEIALYAMFAPEDCFSSACSVSL
jgi:hypothetical protein